MRVNGQGRQPKRSREEWQSVFAEQAASGQTQEAFCAARGLSVSTFCNARRRARAAGLDVVGRPSESFIELTPEAVHTPDGTAPGWDVELALGAGFVLRIRSR